jgi:hypothetical protein
MAHADVGEVELHEAEQARIKIHGARFQLRSPKRTISQGRGAE